MSQLNSREGVHFWGYAKKQTEAMQRLKAAGFRVETTGKQSGFTHRVEGMVRWDKKSGLWRTKDRDGQGVGSMIKYLQKLAATPSENH